MKWLNTLLVPVVFIFVTLLSYLSNQAPESLDLNTAETEFSAQRALIHLKHIAKEPHPTGTPAIKEVKKYLINQLEQLGLSVEIQTSEAINNENSPRMGTIENIIAIKKGSQPNNKKFALMAHYDSRENANGASDDGSGLITILETLRALTHLPPLQNDLVIIFTDGEEYGLLGAQAFVKHPMAKSIGLVLNFEARGSTGPLMMFETSKNNAELISALANYTDYPTANSLTYSIYKKMPNGTDLTHMKNAGIDGMNFAFTGSHYDYHTAGDNAENIDPNSVQHAGSYALALTQNFANSTLPITATSDAIYFNLISHVLISYSFEFAYLMAFITLILLLVVFKRTINNNEMNSKYDVTFSGILISSFALVLQMAWLFILIQSIYGLLGGNADRSDAHFFMLFAAENKLFIAFSLLAACWFFLGYFAMNKGIAIKSFINVALISLAIFVLSEAYLTTGLIVITLSAMVAYVNFRRGQPLKTLLLASYLLWAALLISTIFLLPEASYLFTWPLLVALCFTLYGQKNSKRSLIKHRLMLTSLVGSVLAIYWWSNLIYMMSSALGLGLIGGAMVLYALPLSLAIPAIVQHLQSYKAVSIKVMAVAAIALLMYVIFTDEFSERYKKPESVFYYQDQSSSNNLSYWATSDKEIPTWSQALFTDIQAKAATLPLSAWQLSPAKTVTVEKIGIEVINVAQPTELKTRHARFKLTSGHRGENISIYFSNKERIIAANINGNPVELSKNSTDYWLWRYYALPAQGVEINVTISGDAPIEVKVFDAKWGLPLELEQSMPIPASNTMAKPYTFSGATVLYNQALL